MVIDITEEAERTFDINMDYIEKNNSQIIKILREEIINAINKLPQTYNHYRYMGNKTKFKCMLVHKREFRIIFKIFKKQQLIRIYAILHTRQDIKKYL